MLKRANQILSVVSFMLLLCVVVVGQGTKTQPGNTSTTVATNATNSVNTATSSDREQDGFAGPVRRVKTEVSKLSNKSGKLVEGNRAVLENAAYDIKGTKSEYAYFPSAVSALDLTGRETYKYDEKGNISEMTLFNTDGSLAKKEIYTYDYDFLGNWTKMTTSVAVIEGGKLSYEPTEITIRTISYYMDENVLKQMEAAQKAAAANAASTNASVPQTQTPSASSSQPVSQPPNANTSTKTNASDANHGVQNPQVSTPNNAVSENKSENKVSTSEKKPDDSANAVKSESTNKTETANNTNASNSSPVNTETTKVVPKMLRPVSGGVLNGKAVNLPAPDYPDFAKRSRISGVVSVEVVIDESGKVISAKASSGPGMLQGAAVNAALRAKFSPTLLSGQPVKVTGFINYNFALQ